MNIQQIKNYTRMKKIATDKLSIKVSPHGAELCSIISHGKEYLWQADPKFWKRHSPVLFPIVGSVWENVYHNQDSSYQLSQHGFARDRTFELIIDKPDEVRYRLVSDSETKKLYPFDFCLEIGYRVNDNHIEVIWEVKNSDDKEIHFQIGAHPAFYYPEYHEATSERGYFGFEGDDDLKYIMISEKGCAAPEKEYKLDLSDNLMALDIHSFDKDALIFENGQIKKVTLYNNNKQPYLSLDFTAPVLGLWSPPTKNAPFVCIEPWYGRCDRAHYSGEFKDKEWMQHLNPGEKFNGGYTITIE